MEYRRVGQSDLQVSSIGLGCVTFGREIDADTSFEIMDCALEHGITLFDTAMAYGDGASEEVVGKWLSARGNRGGRGGRGGRGARERIVLATKVGETLTRERILRACDDSLKRLQTDVIDLYQLHDWDATTPLDETFAALDELVQQGKVRHVGVSNFAAWQLGEAISRQEANGWQRLEAIQSPYSLVVRGIESAIIPFCDDQNVGLITFSPLGAGFLTGKYAKGGQVPAGTRFAQFPAHERLFFSDRNFQILDRLRTAADSLGRSMIELALSWVLCKPGVASVLIGARSPAQVQQAFDAEALDIDDATLVAIGA